MFKIDAHVHYGDDHADVMALFDRLDLKLFNVCVAHDASGEWRTYAHVCRQLAERHPNRFAWCTTFDPPEYVGPDFDGSGYIDRVLAGLEADFKAGALACKIWKNIGMRVRNAAGEWVLPDDPLFDAIYAYLAEAGKPLLMHIGEPLACWQPLDESNPHRGYYSNHPEWHMYDKPGVPAHAELIAARDRVLAKHPALRAVGAHLGSLEYDVKEVANRLDRYPNFVVDTSARLHDLIDQNRDAVRDFVLAYQDRILFGTDIVARQPSLSAMPDTERQAYLERLEGRYQSEFAYLESHGKVTLRGRQVQGLGLPQAVLDKIYHANAQAWYPGL